MENLIGLICGAGAAAGVLGLVVLIVKQFLFICSPYEVLIFSGRKRQLQDGGAVGYRIILGGRAVRIQRRLQRRPRQYLLDAKAMAGRVQNDLGRPSTCSAM